MHGALIRVKFHAIDPFIFGHLWGCNYFTYIEGRVAHSSVCLSFPKRKLFCMSQFAISADLEISRKLLLSFPWKFVNKVYSNSTMTIFYVLFKIYAPGIKFQCVSFEEKNEFGLEEDIEKNLKLAP